MQCPKCRDVELKPTKLEEALPAMGCQHCDGALISLLYYRDWAERHQELADSPAEQSVKKDNDSKSALSCPKCMRLMTKFSLSGDTQNRIDLCTSCDEAWLDGGEWSLLKSLDLALHLPKVFTEQWQKKIRQQKFDAERLARLQNLIGEADASKAQEVKQWLAQVADKQAVIRFISA